MLRAVGHRALCVVLLGLTLAAPVRAQTPLAARLGELIPMLMRDRQIVGVALAVVQDGTLVTARAWGGAKRGEETARPDTVFFMDSTTKQFTAAGIMLLVQDGRIDAGLTVIVLTNTVAAPQSKPLNNGDAIAHRVAASIDPRLAQPATRPAGAGAPR